MEPSAAGEEIALRIDPPLHSASRSASSALPSAKLDECLEQDRRQTHSSSDPIDSREDVHVNTPKSAESVNLCLASSEQVRQTRSAPRLVQQTHLRLLPHTTGNGCRRFPHHRESQHRPAAVDHDCCRSSEEHCATRSADPPSFSRLVY